MIEPILELNIPFREPMIIYKNEFRVCSGGPVLSLVAGMHGDEINGMYLLTRLAAFLDGVVTGRERGYDLLGTVRLIPIVNVPGINFACRNWPFDGTDINRMFPGYHGGETTQRIADGVLQATVGSDYAFDIHSSNERFFESPHVRLFSPSEQFLELVPYLRCRYILQRGLTPTYRSQLSYHWQESGISSAILLLGAARKISGSLVEQVLQGLIDFMLATGILAGTEPAPPLATPLFFSKNTYVVLSQAAGIFRSSQRPGAMVRKGEPLGHISNVLTGQLEEEIKAPVSGLLSGLRHYPLVYEQELLARIYSPELNPAVVEDIWYQEQ